MIRKSFISGEGGWMGLCNNQKLLVFAIVHPIGVDAKDVLANLEGKLRAENFDVKLMNLSH